MVVGVEAGWVVSGGLLGSLYPLLGWQGANGGWLRLDLWAHQTAQPSSCVVPRLRVALCQGPRGHKACAWGLCTAVLLPVLRPASGKCSVVESRPVGCIDPPLLLSFLGFCLVVKVDHMCQG